MFVVVVVVVVIVNNPIYQVDTRCFTHVDSHQEVLVLHHYTPSMLTHLMNLVCIHTSCIHAYALELHYLTYMYLHVLEK